MLRDYQQGIDIDPQRYSEIEQRLDAVHARPLRRTDPRLSRESALLEPRKRCYP